MKIEAIYIACSKHDLRLTRILVASIRFWYPQIPVYLVKDRFCGEFDTTEIERAWNVALLETERARFGWGFAKLEPLFFQGDQKWQRCLVLDSDSVFAGPVLEVLESCEGDFVVQQENSSPEFVVSDYFDQALLQQLDPAFVFPGFTFNTSQFVATTGLLKREDFLPFVDWESSPPRVLNPEVFKKGEQGLLNYVLMKKAKQGAITLEHLRFMHVPGCKDAPRVEIKHLQTQSPYRFLLHGCGRKRPRISALKLGAVLHHFERLYYGRVRFGGLKKWTRIGWNWAEETLRPLARKMRGQINGKKRA